MLYKVSAPRDDLWFEPRQFWRTADWKSSSDRPKEGYIQDRVLYAGDFDEVNIHLLPKVRRIRIWPQDRAWQVLQSLGIAAPPEVRAIIVAFERDRETILNFSPTINTFHRTDFEPVPSNEYISRVPRQAIAQETIPIQEAIARWKISVTFVDDLDSLMQQLQHHGVEFSEQT